MDRWDHPGSLTRAVGVVAFFQGRWLGSHEPWGSLDSSRVVLFASAQPGGRWIYLGSFSSLVHVLVFIRGRWGRSSSLWESLRSSRVVNFSRGLPGGR